MAVRVWPPVDVRVRDPAHHRPVRRHLLVPPRGVGTPVVAVAQVEDPGCFWHGDEPARAGDYLMCGECFHCYRSRGDYVAAVHQLCREMDWPVVDELDFCAYCSHSF